MRYDLATAILCALFLSGAGASAAEELPKRKPGLWRLENAMRGKPSPIGPIEMCVDAETDDILRQRAGDVAQACEKTGWTKDGDKFTVKSVCKFGQTKATTEGTFSGSFESNYNAELHIAYEPPIHGMASADMTIAAKWLGPCKPGQKGGDIVAPGLGAAAAPGGKTLNMQDMLKMRESSEKPKR
ncbi:MAG: hypothetical protein C3F11_19415 [Methylocystaceae bacterium]|nr:MAG: hypothetical protein C3F11_19415 [Methylocystaceae bacterium]